MKPLIPVIQLEKISYCYPSEQSPVLNELDFILNKNDQMGLVAPNGAGKTTLFFIIMGLIQPDGGTLRMFDQHVSTEQDFRKVRKQVGLLFQDADDQLFSPTVLEDVAFGPLNLGKTKEEALDISQKTLEMLNLKGFENRVTHKLSGGEKKLVSLATILAMEPEVLLLDEPSAGLDEKTKDRLIEILKGLALTHLIISHDQNFLSALTSKIHRMENGKITGQDA